MSPGEGTGGRHRLSTELDFEAMRWAHAGVDEDIRAGPTPAGLRGRGEAEGGQERYATYEARSHQQVGLIVRSFGAILLPHG